MMICLIANLMLAFLQRLRRLSPVENLLPRLNQSICRAVKRTPPLEIDVLPVLCSRRVLIAVDPGRCS